MKTQIFKNYSDFLQREDKDINGVDQEFAANGTRLGEGCLTDVQFSHKTFWQLLPNRCYVLGGLSALNLI